MSTDLTYTTAVGAWPKGPYILIESNIGTRIGVLPLKFLETCGDNTWEYVSYVISLLIVPDPAHPGSIIDPKTGTAVDLQAAPTATEFCNIYTFVEQGKSGDVDFAKGPTMETSVRPAGWAVDESFDDDPPSSMAGCQGRVIGLQSASEEFYMELLARDSQCMVSGESWHTCEASHIVPWTRNDVYERVDGYPDKNFQPKAGMFLDPNLHHHYNALKWSLYHKLMLQDGVFYVHYFNPPYGNGRNFNGKKITADSFHGGVEPPDPELTAWHYAQTMMARVRGFSWGFESP